MPLLLCPNDNASMSTVKRSGVEFDMCPTCRGVWLDRGELEKLMAVDEVAAAPAFLPPRPAERRSDDDYRERRDYDDDDYRNRGRKKRGIFDIFD